MCWYLHEPRCAYILRTCLCFLPYFVFAPALFMPFLNFHILIIDILSACLDKRAVYTRNKRTKGLLGSSSWEHEHWKHTRNRTNDTTEIVEIVGWLICDLHELHIPLSSTTIWCNIIKKNSIIIRQSNQIIKKCAMELFLLRIFVHQGTYYKHMHCTHHRFVSSTLRHGCVF